MQKLLLLHGAMGSAQSLQPLATELQHDFEVHNLSFEGHGGRGLPSAAFSIEGFANTVRDYLSQNHIGQIRIFGYSMGGYVGLYLARHYPETVEKLYTLATKINWTVEGAAKDAAMLNPAIIRQKVPRYADALSEMHGANWEVLMEQTAQMMLGLGQNPPLKDTDFEQITTPVLLSVGDRDNMVGLEETINTYHKLPQAQLLVMPNTQHPVERVDLKAVAQQIRRFMATSG